MNLANWRYLALAEPTTNGVKHGQVLNIDETIKAIKLHWKIVLLQILSLEIKEVYVGIAGHHIKSLQTRGDIVRQDTEEEITQQ